MSAKKKTAAKKTATKKTAAKKTAAKKTAAKKTAAKKTAKKKTAKTKAPSFKKGQAVKFLGWSGPEPEYDEDDEQLVEGMIGKVRTVGKDIEVAFEMESGTVVVELTPDEIAIATKSDIEAAKAAAEEVEEEEVEEEEVEEEEDDEDESEEEDEEEGYEAMTTSALREECSNRGISKGGNKAQLIARLEENDEAGDEDEEEPELDLDDDSDEEEVEEEESTWEEVGAELDEEGAVEDDEMTAAAAEAGLDINDYPTWAELGAALDALVEDEDEEDEEDEPEVEVVDDTKKKTPAKKPREKSLGKRADEEDKRAINTLTKRAEKVGLDPEDAENGDTWVQFEKTLVQAEKDAEALASLKVYKAVEEEIEEDGDDAVAAAKRLVETAEKTYFTLGGVLTVIARKKLHEGVKVGKEYPFQGKKGLEDFCEQYLNFRYRKAMYLIDIYESATNAGLTEAQLGSIGWTKARELTPILKAEPKAAKKWIDTAKKSSTAEVAESVKARMQKIGAKTHGNTKTAKSVTCKFTVHQDEGTVVEEALALAKEQGDCKTDSEAFAYIVKEWMTFQGSEE